MQTKKWSVYSRDDRRILADSFIGISKTSLRLILGGVSARAQAVIAPQPVRRNR